MSVTFGEVHAPWWDGKDVYVVGGGPSLRGCDLNRLSDRGYVLGVNRAADFVECDATFTQDRTLIWNWSAWLEREALDGEVYLAVDPSHDGIPIPGATYLKRRRTVLRTSSGLSADPSEVANGLNSGYGALNLAVLKRAQRIFLLGFDLDRAGNFHAGYPWSNRSSERNFADWADKFRFAAAALPDGVEVFNANPESRVRAFPFTTYGELGL